MQIAFKNLRITEARFFQRLFKFDEVEFRAENKEIDIVAHLQNCFGEWHKFSEMTSKPDFELKDVKNFL